MLDACVLYPRFLRDTLLDAAGAGLYCPIWTHEILDEVQRNLAAWGGMTAADACAVRMHIDRAFPEANVAYPAELVNLMGNHPKDRHLLAVAVHVGAEFVVTANLGDFPKKALQKYESEAIHPDEFLLYLGSERMAQVLESQVVDYQLSPMTIRDLLAQLEKTVPKFARGMAVHFDEAGVDRPP